MKVVKFYTTAEGICALVQGFTPETYCTKPQTTCPYEFEVRIPDGSHSEALQEIKSVQDSRVRDKGLR